MLLQEGSTVSDSAVLPAIFKEKGSDSNRNGSVIYQKKPYSTKQMEYIQQHHDAQHAVKFVFENNGSFDIDSRKKQSDDTFSSRAPWTHIITVDVDVSSGKSTDFADRMDAEFEPLWEHLMQGNDVVFPALPLCALQRDRRRFVDEGGTQCIFHGLGISPDGDGKEEALPVHLQYIQCKIDELVDIADSVRTVDYYRYPTDMVAGGAMLEMDWDVTPHTIDVATAAVVSTISSKRTAPDRSTNTSMDHQVFSQMMRQKGLIKRQRSGMDYNAYRDNWTVWSEFAVSLLLCAAFN